MWLYILFLFIVFLVFILQFVLVYEDDGGLQKVWAYRLFKFFQYGFRQDLNKVYDGKDKEQYEAEVNRIVESVVRCAQGGEKNCTVSLLSDFNDTDTRIIFDILTKAIEKKFSNAFEVQSYYSSPNYIKIRWW